MKILAIDPGNEESAFLIYDTVAKRPVTFAKSLNDQVLHDVGEAAGWGHGAEHLAIEMVASYGMAVGATVFETCVWIGRFIERWIDSGDTGSFQAPRPWTQVYRRDVKLHLCGSSRAKDTNVRQAIMDRYGSSREVAVGKKATPGPLYGLSGDCWSALGVAITHAEQHL